MRYIQDDHVYNTKIYYKQLYTPIIRVAYILYANAKCVFAENTNKNGIVFSHVSYIKVTTGAALLFKYGHVFMAQYI